MIGKREQCTTTFYCIFRIRFCHLNTSGDSIASVWETHIFLFYTVYTRMQNRSSRFTLYIHSSRRGIGNNYTWKLKDYRYLPQHIFILKSFLSRILCFLTGQVMVGNKKNQLIFMQKIVFFFSSVVMTYFKPNKSDLKWVLVP